MSSIPFFGLISGTEKSQFLGTRSITKWAECWFSLYMKGCVESFPVSHSRLPYSFKFATTSEWFFGTKSIARHSQNNCSKKGSFPTFSFYNLHEWLCFFSTSKDFFLKKQCVSWNFFTLSILFSRIFEIFFSLNGFAKTLSILLKNLHFCLEIDETSN